MMDIDSSSSSENNKITFRDLHLSQDDTVELCSQWLSSYEKDLLVPLDFSRGESKINSQKWIFVNMNSPYDSAENDPLLKTMRATLYSSSQFRKIDPDILDRCGFVHCYCENSAKNWEQTSSFLHSFAIPPEHKHGNGYRYVFCGVFTNQKQLKKFMGHAVSLGFDDLCIAAPYCRYKFPSRIMRRSQIWKTRIFSSALPRPQREERQEQEEAGVKGTTRKRMMSYVCASVHNSHPLSPTAPNGKAVVPPPPPQLFFSSPPKRDDVGISISMADSITFLNLPVIFVRSTGKNCMRECYIVTEDMRIIYLFEPSGGIMWSQPSNVKHWLSDLSVHCQVLSSSFYCIVFDFHVSETTLIALAEHLFDSKDPTAFVKQNNNTTMGYVQQQICNFIYG